MKTRMVVAVVSMFIAIGPSWARDEEYSSDGVKEYSPVGMSAEVGGGVHRFIDTKATDVTKTGGIWTARLAIGTRTRIAGELAYIGTAQNMNTLGVDDKAYLMANGAEGLLRLNILKGMWQPYLGAGIAWKHYALKNTATNTSSVKNSDDVGEIPVAAGLAWRNAGMILDARAGMSNSFKSALIPNASLSSWNVNARVGWEF